MALIKYTIEPSPRLKPAVFGDICIVGRHHDVALEIPGSYLILETVALILVAVEADNVEGRSPSRCFLTRTAGMSMCTFITVY